MLNFASVSMDLIPFSSQRFGRTVAMPSHPVRLGIFSVPKSSAESAHCQNIRALFDCLACV